MLNNQIVSSIPVFSLNLPMETDEQIGVDGLLLISGSVLGEVNGLQTELIEMGREYADQSDALATAQERIGVLESAIRQCIALPFDPRMVGLYQAIGEPLPVRYLGQLNEKDENRE